MKAGRFFLLNKFAIIVCIISLCVTIWLWTVVVSEKESPSIYLQNSTKNLPELSKQINETLPIKKGVSIENNNQTNSSVEAYIEIRFTDTLPSFSQEYDNLYTVLIFIPPIIACITLLYLISSAISLRSRKSNIDAIKIQPRIHDISKKKKSREITYQVQNLESNENPYTDQIDSKIHSSQPIIMGAKTTGQSHRKIGKPCQDAHSYTIQENYVIIAVADGLGSAARSEIGANIAVTSALETIRTILSKSKNMVSFNPKDLMMEVFLSTRQALATSAEQGKFPLRDYATTLIIAISDGSTITTGQIGDGAVVATINSINTLVSSPQEQEYSNETIPLTSSHAIDELQINSYYGKIDEIAVFTDGCQRAALQRTGETVTPYEPFFYPLFSALRKAQKTETGNEMIEELLSSEKLANISDDDKTLVIAFMKNKFEELS